MADILHPFVRNKLFNQTNIETDLRATLGKLRREGLECVWAFLVWKQGIYNFCRPTFGVSYYSHQCSHTTSVAQYIMYVVLKCISKQAHAYGLARMQVCWCGLIYTWFTELSALNYAFSLQMSAVVQLNDTWFTELSKLIYVYSFQTSVAVQLNVMWFTELSKLIYVYSFQTSVAVQLNDTWFTELSTPVYVYSFQMSVVVLHSVQVQEPVVCGLPHLWHSGKASAS